MFGNERRLYCIMILINIFDLFLCIFLWPLNLRELNCHIIHLIVLLIWNCILRLELLKFDWNVWITKLIGKLHNFDSNWCTCSIFMIILCVIYQYNTVNNRKRDTWNISKIRLKCGHHWISSEMKMGEIMVAFAVSWVNRL